MITKSEFTVTKRFLKYVTIDTQSDVNSKTHPSTEKQFDLAHLLVEELKVIGASDVSLDEYCYVMATLPSNVDHEVPTICFCSHMDTSPDSSGTGVKPIVHPNYDGNPITLPDDTSQIITKEAYTSLANQIGNSIITASGTTLLGADNKSGVAEIMAAAEYLLNHPEIKHGPIRILFTPDEEVGRGVDKLDMKKLGADFGYTVDGEEIGSMEAETFSADGMKVIVHGVSIHPGYAKGKLVNGIKILSEILDALPKDSFSPETTQEMEGFVHPYLIEGNVEQATATFIIRDFDTNQLAVHEEKVKSIANEIVKKYTGARVTFEITEQYRNMKEILDKHPQVAANAAEAIKRTGLDPIIGSIRGGTDGSRLSFMGLPCPNIFAGEHAIHSKHEWVSIEDMEAATEMIIHLCEIWAEK